MDQEKKEFEKTLGNLSKGVQWYYLPFTLFFTVGLAYMAISTGPVFDSTHWTLIVLTVVLLVVDGGLIWSLKQK